MKITALKKFFKDLKKILKKNKNILEDIEILKKDLLKNPKKGISLGGGLFKIRLKNSGNNKGKSGGYRIITYFVDEKNTVYLITIYSKSEKENISDFEIKNILEEIF